MRLVDRVISFLNTTQNQVVLVVCKNVTAVKQMVENVRDNIEEKVTASYTKISNEKGAVVFFLTQSSTGCALRGTSLDGVWVEDRGYLNRDLMLAIAPCIKIGG